MTMMLLKDQQQHGLEKVVEKLCTGKPWPTPGKYLRKSALLKMVQAINNVDAEILQAIHDTAYKSKEDQEDKSRSLCAG
jgi:hypothetical protein